MSFRHPPPSLHRDGNDGWPPNEEGTRPGREKRCLWPTRLLRLAPVITAIAWLAFFVAQFGPTGRGAPFGKALLITFAISLAFAIASGAYEPTRMLRRLRSRLPRRRTDWEAFDRERARWERRPH